MERGIWSIYIDIDGFSALWGDQLRAVKSLGQLMLAIFRVGRLCYPEPPDRLCAYQLGDGFLIVSDWHEESLERCATIAVALMRHVAGSGCYARAAIAEGDLADIQGCYPPEVMDCREGNQTVSLHMGLMTITPVMGTALIAAVAVDKAAPRGPLLSVDYSNCARLGPDFSTRPMAGGGLVSVDWVHFESDLLTGIQKTAGLAAPTPKDLEEMLERYSREEAVPAEWRTSLSNLLGIPIGADHAHE